MNEKKFSGYKVAVACFFAMFLNLGLLGSTGVFIPHVAKSLGVQPADIGLMVTFATGGAFLFSLITSNVIEKITAKNTLILALVLNGIHFSIFGFSSAPWMIYASSFMGGAGLAFGSSVACSSIISNWFVKKRASVIGIVFGGAGFGSAFALFAAGQLIQVIGWRNTYFMFTGLLILVGIPIIQFLVVEHPEKIGQKPLGWETLEVESEDTAQDVVKTGLTLEQARKTPTYWFWLFGVLASAMLISGIVTYAPSYWSGNGMDILVASNYTSLISLLGAGLTLFSGIIADRFGVAVYLMYTLGSYIAGGLLLILFPNPTTVTALATVLFLALSYPTSSNYPATITTFAFGNREYTRINASYQAMVYLSKATLPVLILNLTKMGVSLQQTYMMQVALAIFAVALFVIGYIKMKTIEVGETADA